MLAGSALASPLLSSSGLWPRKGMTRNFPVTLLAWDSPRSCGWARRLRPPNLPDHGVWSTCTPSAEVGAKKWLHCPLPALQLRGLSPAPGRFLLCLASSPAPGCAGYSLAPGTPADPLGLDSQHIRSAYHDVIA